MSLLQFLSILRARRAAAALILLTVLALSLAWALVRPERYTADAPVLVDVQAEKVGGGFAPMLVASYMATQIDIARSHRVAQRALDLMQAAGQADASRRREWLQQARERLQVRPARESNIIHVGWSAPTPAEAAQGANALARAFVEVALEIQTAPAKQGSGWYDTQVEASRRTLEAAQTRLSEFQQRAGIVGTEQVDHEIARLRELSLQLAQVQAQTTDSQSRRGAASETVAEVMQSPLVNALKADLARAEARLQESAATLGPRHPQLLRLQAERDALQGRLAAETRRIAGGIEASYRAGRSREQELNAALQAQRQQVLALNRQRGQLAVLQQDVDAARRAFETVSTNASKTRLESLATQTYLTQLAPATEPLEPSGPGLAQILAVAAVAGTLLAVAGALMLEFAQRRVRSVDDIILGADLPVLASLPPAYTGLAALSGPRRSLGFSGGAAA
ncbi:MAG: chain length determinant protein EpsF [Ramlibacter sp.]